MFEDRSRVPIVVGIPVKNEARRIADCLRALSAQQGIRSQRIVIALLLNNCTDETESIVERLVPSLSVSIRTFKITLPLEFANAGYARRLVMEQAETLVEDDGVLLTTDADSCVDSQWIALNLRELSRGADAVAGRIEIDPAEAALIPAKLHEDDARECAYADLLDRIDAELDPDLFDPCPRHSEHSGASIAVTVAAYRQAGGIPNMPLGEDRAFFAALRRVDARIRHAPEVRVVVSGRTYGRAVGGMADTIRRRMIKPDEALDDRLEPAEDAARRARVRNQVRAFWRRGGSGEEIFYLAALLQLNSLDIVRALSRFRFGAAFAELELKSTILIKRRVAVSDLGDQTERARSILNTGVRSLPKIAIQKRLRWTDYSRLSEDLPIHEPRLGP